MSGMIRSSVPSSVSLAPANAVQRKASQSRYFQLEDHLKDAYVLGLEEKNERHRQRWRAAKRAQQENGAVLAVLAGRIEQQRALLEAAAEKETRLVRLIEQMDLRLNDLRTEQISP